MMYNGSRGVKIFRCVTKGWVCTRRRAGRADSRALRITSASACAITTTGPPATPRFTRPGSPQPQLQPQRPPGLRQPALVVDRNVPDVVEGGAHEEPADAALEGDIDARARVERDVA